MQKSLIRKGLVVGIILLFVGASVVPGMSGNIKIYDDAKNKEGIITFGELDIAKTGIALIVSSMETRGDTLYVGGSGPGNYTHIQDAINDSADGGTVFVYNGIYYEHVAIDITIDLVGEDKDTTIIDGSGNGNVVYVEGDNSSISEFTIRNGDKGLMLEECEDVHVDDCNTHDNSNGIYIDDNCHSNVVSNCSIWNSADSGVFLGYWGGVTNNCFYNNTITVSDEIGFYFDGHRAFNNYVDPSNTVNTCPILLLSNSDNQTGDILSGINA